MMAMPKLRSTPAPSCSCILSTEGGWLDPTTQSWWTLSQISLGYDNALVTDWNWYPPTLAISLFYLDRSRTFLLKNLKPERLFFFLVSVDSIALFPWFICSYWNYHITSFENMNWPYGRPLIWSPGMKQQCPKFSSQALGFRAWGTLYPKW